MFISIYSFKANHSAPQVFTTGNKLCYTCISFWKREGPSLVSEERAFCVWIRAQSTTSCFNFFWLRRNSMARNVGSSYRLMCLDLEFLASLLHSLSLSARVRGYCILMANININFCKQFATDEFLIFHLIAASAGCLN